MTKKVRKAIASLQLRVTATKGITEANFMGKAKWTHARKGEIGRIVDVEEVDAGVTLYTVRFDRSGTASSCGPDEISLA
jgi:hypothetical protein